MKRGFTLIELLVVVLIIGILSAVALPKYQLAVEKARAAEAVLTLRGMQRAVDMWIMENGIPDHHGPVFFGPFGDPQDPLSIDFTGRTEYFTYSASCEDGSCCVSVTRANENTSAEIDVTTCKSSPTDDWEGVCRYYRSSHSKIAKAFCPVFGLEPELDIH